VSGETVRSESLAGRDSEFTNGAQQRLSELPLEQVPPVGNLPDGSRPGYASYPHFVGRNDDLRSLAGSLKAGSTAAIGQRQITAATGLGGIGKSQLASEVAYRYGSYFMGGVFWVDFSTRESVPNEIASCGGVGAMGLREDFYELPIKEQTELVMEAWRAPLPRLLIFDNCEDEDLLSEWRPLSGGSRLLVTSRKSAWDPSFGIVSIPLDVFDRSESIQLLREHRPDLLAEDPALNDIADELGDLPLAIDLAGRYLRYYQEVTPGVCLEELRKERLDHESMDSTGAISPTGHVMNVRLTFKLHYDRLNRRYKMDRRAIELLTKLRLLGSGHRIPRALVDATLSSGKPRSSNQRLTTKSLKRLSDLGLISYEEASGDAEIHRLVAEAMSELANEDSQRAVEVAVNEVSKDWDEYKTPRETLKLEPHLRTLIDAAGAREDYQTRALHAFLGNILYRNGKYEQARSAWERAYEISKNKFDASDPLTLQDLEHLGVLAKAEDDLDKALTIYIQVRQTHEQNPRYREVMADPKKASEDEARDFASVHLNIGSVKREKALKAEDIGLLRNVREDYDRALDIREGALRKHIDTAESLYNIGFLELDLKRHDAELSDTYDPRVHLIRSRDMYQELKEDMHPDLLGPLTRLGELETEEGNVEAARSSYEWALKICEAEYVTDDPRTEDIATRIDWLNLNS
jgi:tetratricopeptide (TPR) repeat protein